ncbi:PaaI family thioesterase [Pseudarthrobacter sp. J75]|uniref:PaaI family thioesterase n=1 Tax=unclassified Pseudarthrobacter TaxID=2647000 RepID=UPI002E7FC6BE|nr:MULTISPECIES: PaaI family thioesterase [unclassified Pseudarthrobacter]MEE2523637.1 PaaI family thioesterase [Pseudarthrobacter sp. J47]MEE2530027.1 PaaI family thioesterase [Pseudarthrobacter sp. J75]MEE2570563.1 PaaI family thioesterase [Pseudarthrobacter sp. J64]
MPHPASLEEFTAFVDKFAAKRGFDDIAATLQLQPYAVTEDSVSMSMPLQESYAQASGMYSAAALFGAADITGTLLAMQSYAGSGQFPLAVQSNINFLSNSKASPAVATAKILRGGNTVAVAEVAVADADGKQLIHATFTYAIKDRALGSK